MFLTFLSASLVALGFLAQGGASGPDFPLVVIAVLGLDLFIGLATLGRLASASGEDLRALQAMNRLRHAYLEMVPGLDQYVSQGRYDDLASVIGIYGPTQPQANPLQDDRAWLHDDARDGGDGQRCRRRRARERRGRGRGGGCASRAGRRARRGRSR